jgi:hypothetical protein
MKHLTNPSFALLIFLLLTAFTFAQEPEKPKVMMTQQAPKELSLKTLPAGEKFTSADGLFTVALPKDGVDFEATTLGQGSPKETGGKYSWKVKEGVIIIHYSDDPDFVVKTEKDYADVADGLKAGITVFGATVLSERTIKLGEYRGYEIKFESPEKSKGITRMWIAGTRTYGVFGLAEPGAAGAIEIITSALDSFELTTANPKPKSTPSKLSAEDREKIDQATPAALPQVTAVKKERSDAKDDDLKGKIKTVTEESEDLTGGPWSKYGRHFASITDYDTRGDRLKSVSFNGDGVASTVTVYGYIDGARVDKSASVRPNPNRYTIVGEVSRVPPHAPDPRFDSKWLYKYANGKLIGMDIIESDGLPGMRYVYNHVKGRREEIAYDHNGEINQKYHYILDEKGNEIERIDFSVRPQDSGVDTRYRINIASFDAAGNWTERTVLKPVTENGKQVFKPMYREYRTIAYW